MFLGCIKPFASRNLSKRIFIRSPADQYVKVRVPSTKTGYRERQEYAVKAMN